MRSSYAKKFVIFTNSGICNDEVGVLEIGFPVAAQSEGFDRGIMESVDRFAQFGRAGSVGDDHPSVPSRHESRSGNTTAKSAQPHYDHTLPVHVHHLTSMSSAQL